MDSMNLHIDWPNVVNAFPPYAFAYLSLVAIAIYLFPSHYDHFNPRQRSGATVQDFTDDDKSHPDRSGWTYYQSHKDKDGALPRDCSVAVVVLGDIGRSPRMQNHALSIARRGGHVILVGYVDSDLHPHIVAHRLITVLPLSPFPKFLQTTSKLLFLFTAPLKVAWQSLTLFRTLAYRAAPTRWLLIQNPPAIPTLFIAQVVCFLRNQRLLIDWHNFGYSLLALRFSPTHPLVSLSRTYENVLARNAYAHFTVTDAMSRALSFPPFNLPKTLPLHDRPAAHFTPLGPSSCEAFLANLSQTAPHVSSLKNHSTRLLVSPTSWTPDEDFSLLLSALVSYSSACVSSPSLPHLLLIITGKGPQKSMYERRIAALTAQRKLLNVTILTAFLPSADYASLLASADLGISLHTSSSGVDLPMKVVDMFGCGLPVAGWSDFEAWPELVTEGVNGRGFASAEELARVLREVFGAGGRGLEDLRKGVEREVDRRWEGEWAPVMGRVLELEK